jgi:hypothetical protein
VSKRGRARLITGAQRTYEAPRYQTWLVTCRYCSARELLWVNLGSRESPIWRLCETHQPSDSATPVPKLERQHRCGRVKRPKAGRKT